MTESVISIKCPSCSAHLRAKTSQSGKPATCPKCGAVIDLAQHVHDPQRVHDKMAPPLVAKRAAPPVVTNATGEAAPPRQTDKARSFTWLILFVTVSIAMVAAFTFGFVTGRASVRRELQNALAESARELESSLTGSAAEPNGEAASPAGEVSPTAGGSQLLGSKERAERDDLSVGSVHQGEHFSLTLKDVSIDTVEAKSAIDDTLIRSDDRYLIFTFDVHNTDDRKILNKRRESAFGRSQFLLVDDVDNQIRGVSFGFSTELVHAIPPTDDVAPGDSRLHQEVFTIPPPKTKYLRLTVNLEEAFGGDGTVTFRVPSDQITGFVTEQ